MRIAGVTLNPKKSVRFALTKIYGIGPYRSKMICEDLNIQENTKIKDLDSDIAVKIMKVIENRGYKITGDLQREINFNKRRLINIRCYRGERLRRKLPAHGQRTHTNARSCRRVGGSL